ncbi:MAG: hypothetical protein IJO29_09155 [Oscillospiraceae bacterium]|nr:hypothetical protein [Oscillospiraceae bacterium]
MEYGFLEIVMFFFIYAFVGWSIEVIFYTVNTGKFVNRGFLNGPWCPIYGVSFSIIIMLLTPLQDNLAVLFFGSFFLATLMEFVTGFLLEKIFNEKWWDYTDEPFNIKGYICLRFSLMWGLACTFVMRIVHPLIAAPVQKSPEFLLVVIACTLSVAFFSDLIFTVNAIRKLRMKLKLSREISERLKYISDHIGEDISEATINVMERAEESREKLAEAKTKRKQSRQERREKLYAELEELRQRYQEYVEKRSFTQKRLDKAFPRLDFDRKNEEGKTLTERIREAIESYKNN